ncbi:MAG: phenylacetate--CoA ligase [Deltaproteobacteria bacterium]|nr:MAG: phenylacetate--CoA ligase [Deltaproteobacteria bacterium]
MDRTSGLFSAKAETLSRDEQRAIFEKKTLALIGHAYENAPAVRALFEREGLTPADISSLEDLPKIPVTPKAALVRMQEENPPFGGLLAVPLESVQRVFQSPGPINDPQGKGEGWGWEEALFACGFRPGDISVNTFSYHMTPAGIMFDDSLIRIGCPVVPTGIGDREAQINILKNLGVSGYVGMASFLLQIGEKAIEMGLDPKKDLSLKAAFTTAEPLPDSLRDAVENMFGLILRQGYGTADCGCLAYECYHRGGMHLTTRAYVEIVDPQTGMPMESGEVGEVVVTVFNEAYPLIRFGTGDLSAIDEGHCQCGRTSPKLRGWLGRADTMVKVKGMFVHPGQIQKVMSDFTGYAAYRAVVERTNNRDSITLLISGGNQSSEAKEAIEEAIRKVLRIGGAVSFVAEGTLPADGQILEDKRTWE